MFLFGIRRDSSREEAAPAPTTDCYSRRRLLRHLVLSSSFISVFHPPLPLLLLYSPRNTGAVLLLPPAASSYPLPTLRRQQRRRRCSHFSSKALPARCSSSEAIGKMDRRKKARTEKDGEKRNRVHPLSRMMHKEDTFLRYVFLLLKIL